MIGREEEEKTEMKRQKGLQELRQRDGDTNIHTPLQRD